MYSGDAGQLQILHLEVDWCFIYLSIFGIFLIDPVQNISFFRKFTNLLSGGLENEFWHFRHRFKEKWVLDDNGFAYNIMHFCFDCLTMWSIVMKSLKSSIFPSLFYFGWLIYILFLFLLLFEYIFVHFIYIAFSGKH